MGVISLVAFVAFAPESPKWLLIEGRTEEAMAELGKIAKFNGSDKEITTVKIDGNAIFTESESNLSLGTYISMKSYQSVLSSHSA